MIANIYAGRTTAARPLALPERAAELAAMNRLADQTIIELVERQIDARLDVVTDGELRRTTFLSSFYDAIAPEALLAPDALLEIRDEQGSIVKTMFNDPMVKNTLRKESCPAAEETAFMRSITDFPFKITLPAPSYFFTDFVGIEHSDYKTRHELVTDAVEIEKRLVGDVIAAGARWIQFDFPLYPQLVDASQSGPLLAGLGFCTPADKLQACVAMTG